MTFSRNASTLSLPDDVLQKHVVCTKLDINICIGLKRRTPYLFTYEKGYIPETRRAHLVGYLRLLLLYIVMIINAYICEL
jgi:hypothetical protein